MRDLHTNLRDTRGIYFGQIGHGVDTVFQRGFQFTAKVQMGYFMALFPLRVGR
jgi:hypothetical protein